MLKLPVLSLREYLELKYDLVLESYTLEALYANHEKIAYKILDAMNDKKYSKNLTPTENKGHTLSTLKMVSHIFKK